MKHILAMLLLLTAIALQSQTLELEKAYLTQQFQAGKISQSEYASKGGELNKIKGDFPTLPWDTLTRSLVVDQQVALPGTKRMNMKRIKEWAAINFGALSAVLHYEDEETGILILKGFVNVDYTLTYRGLFFKSEAQSNRDLYFTMKIESRDNGARVQFMNLGYREMSGGYTVGANYIPRSERMVGFATMFPVSAGDMGQWKGTLSFAKSTVYELQSQCRSLEVYVQKAK